MASTGNSLLHEHWLQAARPIQRDQVIAATDMDVTDEDLRHGPPPAGELDEALASLVVVGHVEFLEGNPPRAEEGLGPYAEGAPGGRVKANGAHRHEISAGP